jgi:hypothetical protein
MSIDAHSALRLLALAVIATAACPAAATADNTRYVSITGSNANDCTLAAPCRTLQRAINRTPAGGELRILDSGGYGNNASITKSLTISGNGHTVYLGAPLTISSPAAVVALRGLVLNGRGTVTHGISIDEAAVQAVLHIERSVISAFTQTGIRVASNQAEVAVLDSISRDNGTNGFALLFTTGSRVTIHNSHFNNNALTGVQILSGRAVISRSTASGNGARGIDVGTDGFVSVDSSVAVQSGIGLRVQVGGNAVISNSTFTRNNFGISNNGTVSTRQNNTVSANVTNLSGNALVPIGGV